MLTRDDATVFLSLQKASNAMSLGQRPQDRTVPAGNDEPASENALVTDGISDEERPFYSRPSQRNQRTKPFQKGFIAAGFLISATSGYFLGLNQQDTASQRGLSGKTKASSSAVKPETEYVTLKGGIYSMGDSMDGLKDARSHQVRLAPFTIAKYEVSLELWDSVVLWGRDHGYSDLPEGLGKAHNHPVSGMSWGDAVKWCNALSEKEGLTPCYYTGSGRQSVARKGMVDIGNQQVNWKAPGYRLPTEAEWEFAARGGLPGKRFPCGNEITQDQANYHGSSRVEYDKCKREGTASALMSSQPYTAVIGSLQPNGFGLHDMAGNVSEWCWDFYDPEYGASVPLADNPRGPDKGKNCVVRGGSWRHTAAEARCASRFSLPGDVPAVYIGFRVVRSL